MGVLLDSMRKAGLPFGGIVGVRNVAARCPSPFEPLQLALASELSTHTFMPLAQSKEANHHKGLLWSSRREVTLYGASRTAGGVAAAPDLRALRRYEEEPEPFTARDSVEVQSESLDRLIREGALPQPEILEIQVLGAELEALKGALVALSRSLLAVSVTTQLEPLFSGAPLFGEVDSQVRKWGFTLVEFNVQYRRRASGGDGPLSTEAQGSPVAVQALWLREPVAAVRPSALSQDVGALLRLAAIADGLGKAGIARQALEAAAQAADDQGYAAGIRAALTPSDHANAAPPRPPSGTEAALTTFRSAAYRRLNRARLDHLSALGLPIEGRSVLEVGAGVGDLTSYFIERGCEVLSTDGRPDNVALIAQTAPQARTQVLDLDRTNDLGRAFDIVFCYGTLYHLSAPGRALQLLSNVCTDLLLVETVVARDGVPSCLATEQPQGGSSGALGGVGCLPNRAWVMEELRGHFAYVYAPTLVPAHPEFPEDWSQLTAGTRRQIFVASRRPLSSPLLIEALPLIAERMRPGRLT